MNWIKNNKQPKEDCICVVSYCKDQYFVEWDSYYCVWLKHGTDVQLFNYGEPDAYLIIEPYVIADIAPPRLKIGGSGE